MQSNISHLSDIEVAKKIKILAVSWGFNTFAFSIIYPFLPLYLNKTRGIPMDIVGLIYPIMGVAAIISGPLSGVLADRIGRRKLIVWGPLGRSIVFFFLACMAYLNASFALIALGLFASTLLGNFFQNGSNAYVTDIIKPKDRTVAFSTLRVGLNVGWMLGPALGSFLAETPFYLLFALTGMLCLVTSRISYVHCTESYRQQHNEKATFGSFGKLLKEDSLLAIIIIITFLMFVSVSQFVSTLTVFATGVAGIKPALLGYLYTINGAIIICFLIPANKLLNKMNQLLRISIGAFLYIIALMGFGFAPLWGQASLGPISLAWLNLAASMVIITLAEIMSITAIVTIIGRLAPEDKIGRYMGLYGLTMGISWAFGPYFGLVLFEKFECHPIIFWQILSFGAIIGFFGFLYLALHPDPRLDKVKYL